MAEQAGRYGVRAKREAIYVMSVAAELVGMHPQTIRTYERKGLIRPSRTEGGRRIYSQGDIARLFRIKALVEEGLNMEGVKRVLDLERELEQARARLRDLEDLVEELKRAIRAPSFPMVPVSHQLKAIEPFRARR